MTDLAPSPDERRVKFTAYALLTTTTLCWAGNAVAGKMAVGEVSPMMLVFLRWVLAFLLILAIGWRGLARDWPVLRPRLRFVAAMGALGFTAFNALFYAAAHYTTALNIGILQGAMPVLVLIGAYLVHRTRVGQLQSIGVLITMAGVVAVVSRGDLGVLLSLAFNFGDLLMLLACVLYSGYTVALRDKPPVAVNSLMTVMAGAALLASLPLVLGEAALGQLQAPTLEGWAILLFIAIFPSTLAQVFWMKGVAIIGPGRAGVFINLVPIFAAVLAVLLLAERFEPYHLVSLGLVLGGIWLAERKRR